MKHLPLLITMLAFSSCDMIRGSGQWEVTLHDVDNIKALTFREMPEASKELTVIFSKDRSGVLKPRTFRLPEEAEEMPETEVSFFDTTRLPGRITILSDGHSFDVMERALFVDGIEYLWERTEPIKIE